MTQPANNSPYGNLKWTVVRRGKTVATVEAPSRRDALILIAEKFGHGAWLLPEAFA